MTCPPRARRARWDTTLWVFLSDNGGLHHGQTAFGSGYPLRGGKTTSWEGGVRTLAFVSGGALPPHAASRYGGLMSVADWFATLCAAAGVDAAVADDEAVPGLDSLDHWAALLAGDPTGPRTELPLSFCDGSNFTGTCVPAGYRHNGSLFVPHEGALINGTLKVVVDGTKGWGVWLGPTSPNGTANGAESTPGDDPGCPAGCLFDLAADPTEHHDLSLAQPDVFENMLGRLAEWGRTLFQTNYSDAADSTCLDDGAMLDKYGGFLGPRCGVDA